MSPSSNCSSTSRTSASLNNLATAVSARFEKLGRLEDLEEAITCYHQALALRPNGLDRSSSLVNISNAVYARFKQSRSNDDLLDAVKYLSEVKNIFKLPTGNPFQSTISISLISIFLIQCDNVSNLDESLHMMTKAFDLFKHAADLSPASAKDRFYSAVRWAREAHCLDHQSALDASTTLLGRRLILSSLSKISLLLYRRHLPLMPLPVPTTEENLDLSLSYWNKGGLYYGQNCEVIGIH